MQRGSKKLAWNEFCDNKISLLRLMTNKLKHWSEVKINAKSKTNFVVLLLIEIIIKPLVSI